MVDARHPVSESPAAEDADPRDSDRDRVARELRQAIARAVRRVCPAWLADQADDLTQIATARVLARVDQTGGTVAFTAGYLYRAAYSALIDEIRKRRRLREDPFDDHTPEPRAAVSPRASEAWEIRDAVKACLARLAASRRRAVMLHLQGHSTAEAAGLLGCSTKSAENLIYRGLADLRACLVARGVTP